MTPAVDYEVRYLNYQRKTGLNLKYSDFMKVGILSDIHRRKIGTVVDNYNPNLIIYPHMLHFGSMFFYQRLSVAQILNGPMVEQDLGGSAY